MFAEFNLHIDAVVSWLHSIVMSVVFTSGQMKSAERRYAEAQLSKAARDLHQKAHADYSLEEIERTISSIAERASALGIKRIKWLKILTLWHLYPAASPDPEALGTILRDQSRTQDARMLDAVALPVPAGAQK